MHKNDSNKITVREIKIEHVIEDLRKLDKNKKKDKYTDILCWHCCHEFNNFPYFIPSEYIKSSKKYKVLGVFCSWCCAKRYSMDKDNMGIKSQILTNFIKDSEGKYTRVKPAPPRSLLKSFGGILTIKEFRNYHNESNEKDIRELLFNMTSSPLIFEETITGDLILPEKKNNSIIDLNITSSNTVESWKLKRTKPLKNTKGTLESTMGLFTIKK